MSWVTLAAAGLSGAAGIGGALLGADAQQTAINTANAQNRANIRNQQGILNQQMELARPLIETRDGALGVLAQRFGLAPPTPTLQRSAAEGTALIPVPTVSIKDRVSGGPDVRSDVYYDPVNRNFTDITGQVIADASRDGVVPGLTQDRNNTVEIRNGQVVGVGSSGVNNVLMLPPVPPAQNTGFQSGQQFDMNGNPINTQPGGPGGFNERGNFAVDGQGNVISGTAPGGAAGPNGDVNGNVIPGGSGFGTLPGIDQGQMAADAASSGWGMNTGAPGAPSLYGPTGINAPPTASGEDLFGMARGMLGDQQAGSQALLGELTGMVGQDQLDFELSEGQRQLERIMNARGLRNSGREFDALIQRNTDIIGNRQDQRITNLLRAISATGQREDAGYGQARDLAAFLGGRNDQTFNRALADAQFGAGRADQEIANLFALAGLGNTGTAAGFNAGAGFGGALNSGSNIAQQLALAGGANQANLYGNVATGVGNSLFDFARLWENRTPPGQTAPTAPYDPTNPYV